MSRPTLLRCPEGLRVVCLESEASGVVLVARCFVRAAPCPRCGVRAGRIHSRDVRTAADLPWLGVPARLRLHVRRFFCDAVACARRIFAERLPGVVAPGARRTERLGAWLTHVAFALGGSPGARLLRVLGVAVCGDTLLTHVRRFPLRNRPVPRVLSVDDFALRRGRTCGTRVVARDRGSDYAEGARREAPDAVQVADRFHLLKDVGEVAERCIAGTPPSCAASPRQAGLPPEVPHSLPAAGDGSAGRAGLQPAPGQEEPEDVRWTRKETGRRPTVAAAATRSGVDERRGAPHRNARPPPVLPLPTPRQSRRRSSRSS